MKKLYIKPEVEIKISVFESSLLAGTGIKGDALDDELDDGGSGDGLEGDANTFKLWED